MNQVSDSLITKKAIAAGLKELTKKKSFDKISIRDITEICGLNRQTFYYHFQDKYDLADWIYYNEAISIMIEDLTYDNWDDNLRLMLTQMKKESYFYQNTLSLNEDNGFRDYLLKIAGELFMNIIVETADELDTADKKFMSEFYAFGVTGVIVSWAQHGMKESPESVTSKLKNVSYGTRKFAAMVPTHNKEDAN